MLVYFAHPIDQASGPSGLLGGTIPAMTLYDIVRTFQHAELSLYRPGSAFSVASGSFADLSAVQQINSAALHTADALLAWLPAGVPTLGVPAEIETALRHNKPTLILTDGDLIVKSVQVNAWRELGAQVSCWGLPQAEAWESEPEILHKILRRQPSEHTLSRMAITNGSQHTAPVDPPPARWTDDLLWTGAPNLSPGRYEGDAGLDLAIAQDVRLRATDYQLVPTGVHVAIPDGYFGLITGRSSTWAKHRCRVTQAVIDSGYRGELMIGLLNEGQTVTFETGTRLAQLILLPTFQGGATQVDELPESHRGSNGYGSSGQ